MVNKIVKGLVSISNSWGLQDLSVLSLAFLLIGGPWDRLVHLTALLLKPGQTARMSIMVREGGQEVLLVLGGEETTCRHILVLMLTSLSFWCCQGNVKLSSESPSPKSIQSESPKVNDLKLFVEGLGLYLIYYHYSTPPPPTHPP